MKNPAHRLSRATLCGLFLAAAAVSLAGCQDGVVTGSEDAGPGDGEADLSIEGNPGSADLARSSTDMPSGMRDMANPSSDLGIPGSPESNPMLSGITAEHNKARAAVMPVPATALPPLTWNTTVAAAAQAWADGCQFRHNPSTPYGENIYAGTGNATPVAVVANWVAEKASYNYSANACSATCGHYTQVVWRTSVRLGCGVKNCTTGSPFGSGAWQLWVCNYDPPGNSGGRPY